MPDIVNFSSMPIRRTLAIVVMLLLSVLTLGTAQDPQQDRMRRGQKHESRHAIDQLEETWRTAIVTSNAATMASLLSDDYMGISPSGTLQSKEQTINNLSSGRIHVTTMELSDRKVRFYGKTALVTSLATVTGTNAEGDITGSFRYTRVYVRDDRGQWKIVSFEASRIRNFGERR